MRTESKRQIEHLETELKKSVENCPDLITKFNEQSDIMKIWGKIWSSYARNALRFRMRWSGLSGNGLNRNVTGEILALP